MTIVESQPQCPLDNADDDGNVSFVNMGFGQLVCTAAGSSLVRRSGRTAKWRQSARIHISLKFIFAHRLFPHKHTSKLTLK